jgi:hypothetical protein
MTSEVLFTPYHTLHTFRLDLSYLESLDAAGSHSYSPARRAVWTVGRMASANSSADTSLFRLH